MVSRSTLMVALLYSHSEPATVLILLQAISQSICTALYGSSLILLIEIQRDYVLVQRHPSVGLYNYSP